MVQYTVVVVVVMLVMVDVVRTVSITKSGWYDENTCTLPKTRIDMHIYAMVVHTVLWRRMMVLYRSDWYHSSSKSHRGHHRLVDTTIVSTI